MKYIFTLALWLGYTLAIYAQPVMLKAIQGDHVELNGTVFFVGDDNTYGQELWKSDGTNTGTTLVKDLTPGSADSDIRNITASGGMIYFVSRPAGASGDQLWKSDGTPGGTVMVKAFGTRRVYSSGIGEDVPTELGGLWDADGTLVFLITGEAGELWRSDGTEAGTIMKTNYNKGWYIEPNRILPSNTYTHGGAVYFMALKGFYLIDTSYPPYIDTSYIIPDPDYEVLFGVDVTSGNVDSLYQFYSGFESIRSFFNFSGQTYFAAGGGDYGLVSFEALFKTDGTTNGTDKLLEFNDYRISDVIEYNGDIYVRTTQENYEISHIGQFWKVDGQTGNASLIKDFDTFFYGGGGKDMAIFNADIYMGGANAATGAELWKSNGTPAGTELFKDLYPGPDPNNSDPLGLVKSGDYLFFSAVSDGYGRELWLTDGTVNGTMMLKDINSGPANSFNSYFDPFNMYDEWQIWDMNGELIFVARSNNEGQELWASDGTTAGTRLLADINPGSQGSSIRDGKVVGNKFFFTAVNGSDSRKLWVYQKPSVNFYISSYTLVNAATDQDIQTLNDGDVITINSFFSNDYNVRANTFPEEVGSVNFYINDYFIRTENRAPYAVGGDNPVGDYWSYTIFPGVYTLRGIPYSEANGGGIAGPEKSITVTVVYNGWNWSWKEGVTEEHLRMYPNPVHDKLVLELYAIEPATIRLNIYDQAGRAVIAEKHEKAPGLWTNRLKLGDLPSGVYTLVTQWGEKRITRRLVKN